MLEDVNLQGGERVVGLQQGKRDAFQEEVKVVEEVVVEAPVLQFVEVDVLAQLHLVEQNVMMEEKAVQEEGLQEVLLGEVLQVLSEEELVLVAQQYSVS